MADSLVTLQKETNKQLFYIHSDGSCTWNGIVCEDFAQLFIYLADLGWSKVKEVIIPLPEKDTLMEMPSQTYSRKREFTVDWQAYLFANKANL